MSVKLFVGNLPFTVSETQLEELFGQNGAVVSTKIIRDHASGNSKGFGFVEMSSKEDADKAVQALNGHQIDGRSMRVDEARPPQAGGGNRGGGGGRGGFGGGGGGRYRDRG